MKQLIKSLLFLVVLIIGTNVIAGEKDKVVKHRFIASGHGFQKIVIVNEDKQIEWEYKVAGQCNDLSVLSDQTILFSTVDGAKLINLAKETLWVFKGEAGTEIQSASPLKNGNFLIMQNGNPAKLMEISRSGKIAKEIIIPTNTNKPHGQFRNIRKTNQDTYLIGYMHGDKVCEFDGDGKLVRTIKTPKHANVYSAVRLKNGNTLIACGDGHELVEVDKEGEIVWHVKENDLPGCPLRFVGGVQRLRNGNTVICNWGGHGHKGEQAQLIEITPDKKIVWQVNDWKNFGALSTCQILDEKGKMEKGQLER
ncbi:hypothetical protein EYV94_09765 [Puteibacter caeruleilacunae]|nr:hypothetical protein EYV94_09765 [Puteibacter caeruleilacunae]